jgi:hypothetical protein
VLKNRKDVIASDRRERSNLVFASEKPDCFVASLPRPRPAEACPREAGAEAGLAMTNPDFFNSLLKEIALTGWK